MEAKRSVIGAATGFVLGCLALLGLYLLIEALVERVRMRPLALAALPFMCLWVGCQFGNEISDSVKRAVAGSSRDTPSDRSSIFWMLVVAFYLLTFEPLGRRIYSDDWIFLMNSV